MSEIKRVSDALDPANIKVVVNSLGYGVYCSRAVIPQPFGSLHITYQKFVGLGMFSHEALKFFSKQKKLRLKKLKE